MKILILTAATGGGHLKAAAAIDSYIKEHTDYEVLTVDALKSVGHALDKIVCGSYLFMARKSPKLFGKLYKDTNKDTHFANLVPRLSARFSKRLLPAVESFAPDAIITTHPFATEMISSLKEHDKVSAPLICLMTDYGAHRAWIDDYVDAYVVASNEMIDELKAFGVNEKIIYPFGIPVRDIFFSQVDRGALLKEMGFSLELPTVLFMAGSFGVSNIMRLYDSLVHSSVKMQVIIITGKNQKLYDKFEKELASPEWKDMLPTKLIFYTDEVEKYMHASDLLVTKPGGLTVSEALACNLPLVVFDAIPGQEEDNADFLSSHGMGIKLDSSSDFATQISALLEDRSRLDKMRNNCLSFDKSSSVHDLLELIKKLAENSQA